MVTRVCLSAPQAGRCHHLRMRWGAGALVVVLTALVLGGCLPTRAAGTLAPTLSMQDVDGGTIALQNGVPVPSFEWQPRPRIDLDGPWRVQREPMDQALTMRDRETSLPDIEAEADGRQAPGYDDSGWPTLAVPGTTNPPPDGDETGAWYRRGFQVPPAWNGRAVTLRFASANYVADVWVNGTWVGYHEGGSTPFAFEVGHLLRAGAENLVAVRVHTVGLGTRADIVPWGLIDWWNYGGLTGSVWLEASGPASTVRADVVPHLDAVEVDVVLRHTAALVGTRTSPGNVHTPGGTATVTATILPATVRPSNLLSPDPRDLLTSGTAGGLETSQEVEIPSTGEASVVPLSLTFGDADLWSPQRPALYVLRVELRWNDRPLDAREARQGDIFWTTFGLRHLAVDESRVLLNGTPIFLRGVGVHDESLDFDADGALIGGSPYETPRQIRDTLDDASRIGANFIRAGHQPASPLLLTLADRLGFAVWEEIPLYHATPYVFERVMARGIPQQMLREMALRDMNHPSVLFHGFANESTGQDERESALAELHDIDREIDGTRLTGQAAYGWQPDDPTQSPLDVAGYTFYYGVFYGDDAAEGTRRALGIAHEAHPDKPIMVLEFGRWADTPADEAAQRRIFEETYPMLQRFRADAPGGFLAAATWWTLRDFATQIAGIGVEDFGLIRPDGELRPAGELAADAFHAPAGEGAQQAIEPQLERPRSTTAVGLGEWRLAAYLGYATLVSLVMLGAVTFALTRRGGRALGRRR
jgi:beta-glucuronidase